MGMGWDSSTHHARTLGHMGEGLLSLCFVDEGLDLICGVVARVKVGPHHRVDDARLVGHLCHHSRFHRPHSRLLHRVHYLRLLAFRHAAEPNR